MSLMRTVCEEYLKLAKRDLKRIKRKLKKNKRATITDAFTLGQIDIEVGVIADWIDEIIRKEKQ